MNDQIKTEQQNEAQISPSELNVGLERTALTENEFTKLMLSSSHDKFINCAYGKNGVDLLPTDGNKWAFDMIAEMRSNRLALASPC